MPVKAKKYVWICYCTNDIDYDGKSIRGPVEYVCDTQRKADKWLSKRQADLDELDEGEQAFINKVEVQ